MIKFEQWNLKNEQTPPVMNTSAQAKAKSAVGGGMNFNRLASAAEKTNKPGNPLGSGGAVEMFVRKVIEGNDPQSQLAVLRSLRKLVRMFPALVQQQAEQEPDETM